MRVAWPTQSLRRLASGRDALFTDGDWIETPYLADEGIRLVQTGNIGTGAFRSTNKKYISNATFRELDCTEVLPEDILICRLAAPVGRACLAPRLPTRMITSVDVCVMRPRADVDRRYVVYALSSQGYLHWMASECRGGTRDRVSRQMLGRVNIPLPPLKAQRAIVRFLDEETAKIDALIQKQSSVVQAAAQIRARRAIDFFGPCTTPLRRTILEICDGPFGSNLKTEHYASEGVRVIRLQNIGAGEFLDDDKAFVAPEHFGFFRRHEARQGDLLIGGLGDENNLLGRSCLMPKGLEPAMVKADCFRLRLNQSRVLHEFVMHFLNSPVAQSEIIWQSRGATRIRMNAQGITAINIPLPSLREQTLVVQHLDELDRDLRLLRGLTRRATQKLKEYRAALVTAAVTGQVDILGAA